MAQCGQACRCAATWQPGLWETVDKQAPRRRWGIGLWAGMGFIHRQRQRAQIGCQSVNSGRESLQPAIFPQFVMWLTDDNHFKILHFF